MLDKEVVVGIPLWNPETWALLRQSVLWVPMLSLGYEPLKSGAVPETQACHRYVQD